MKFGHIKGVEIGDVFADLISRLMSFKGANMSYAMDYNNTVQINFI